jgi:hypothetical protein
MAIESSLWLGSESSSARCHQVGMIFSRSTVILSLVRPMTGGRARDSFPATADTSLGPTGTSPPRLMCTVTGTLHIIPPSQLTSQPISASAAAYYLPVPPTAPLTDAVLPNDVPLHPSQTGGPAVGPKSKRGIGKSATDKEKEALPRLFHQAFLLASEDEGTPAAATNVQPKVCVVPSSKGLHAEADPNASPCVLTVLYPQRCLPIRRVIFPISKLDITLQRPLQSMLYLLRRTQSITNPPWLKEEPIRRR